MLDILFSYDFPQNAILFLILAAALIFSLVLHELGHAYVALWNGDRTAQVNGRCSFNPLRHLDPIGTVMLLTVGFGFAKPVPVNHNNFRHPRKGMFTVAIAGVTVNIIIAFISCAIFTAIERFSSGGTGAQYVWLFFYYLSLLNISLLFFNLIPVFPLDGFRIIESFKPYGKYTQFMRRYGQFIFLGLVALSIMVDRFGLQKPFSYIDILGTYIEYTVDALMWVFEKFWGLIFGV